MIFLGAFRSAAVQGPLHESLAIVATLGLVFGATYYLWTLQRMFFGPFNLKENISPDVITDVTTREKIMLIPLAVITLFFGVYPQPMIAVIDPFAKHFAEFVLSAGKSLTLNP